MRMKIANFVLLIFIAIACEKPNVKVFQTEGYIVGFDPCTIRHNYDIGYIIFTIDLQDTLVTYNFPDNIYEFPVEYFANYMNSAYIPVSARYDFKVRFSYTIARENERTIHECLSDFNNGDFSKQILNNQIIIKSASKYK